MTDEEILESVGWHFLIGNAGMTSAQWAGHQERGTCAGCEERAREFSAVAGRWLEKVTT